MSNYLLYHAWSDKWVCQLLMDNGDYDHDKPYISTVSYCRSEQRQFAKVFNSQDTFNSEEYQEKELGFTRIHLSDDAYTYYSDELGAYLSAMATSSDFEHWYETGKPIYPSMKFTPDELNPYIVRDFAQIKWLKENTKLKAVRIDE